MPVVAPSTSEEVLRDLDMSGEEDTREDTRGEANVSDDDEEALESSTPGFSAAYQEARPLASVVKQPKQLQRKLAKLMALTSAPTRKPTLLTVVSSRRRHASQTAPPLDRDNSKEDPPADHAPT